MKATRSVLCLFPENSVDGMEGYRQKYIFHPGKSVPFHITLLHNFFSPEDIDGKVIDRLKEIARGTPKFEFQAKPLSSFPTTRVLYLTPAPATPIEELTARLFDAFPDFHNPQYGFPVFHMTVALGYPEDDPKKIVNEYFDTFGKEPLDLKAGHLGIYVESDGEWKEHLAIQIGCLI